MGPSTQSVVVLKIGGNQVEDPEFLAGFVAAVKTLCSSYALIIVHGGGKEIAELHDRFGVPFETVQGLRATSNASMPLVEMALNGAVNTRLVAWLVNGGVDALGLSGVDLGLVRVQPMVVPGHDLGRVGRVTSVNEEALWQLLALHVVPVISPVSLGHDGLTYNVNADHVATALATAVEAARLVFVTNVPGVQVAGRTVRALVPAQVEDLIARGIVSGGMIPKVRSATDAVAGGVRQAVITDLAGLAKEEGTAVLREA
jgi:acetylglutamate kinase